MALRSPALLPLADGPLRSVEDNPLPAVAIGLAALVVVVLLGTAARRMRAKVAPAQALTVVAAAIATCVAAQGMWRFFGDVLQLNGPLRALLFAFIEVSVLASAVRARQSMRERHTAGVDGLAVWVLTSLSAVLSSLDSRSFGEAVFRLVAPLIAAWLWERGMAVERIRLTGRSRINWRIKPERVLVRIGLADPTDRTAGEVDAQRRLMRLALCAQRTRTLRDEGKSRRAKRAAARLQKAMRGAVEYGGLGTDPERQDVLLAHLSVLYNAADLLNLAPTAPWAPVPSGTEPDPAPQPDGDRIAEVLAGSADKPASMTSRDAVEVHVPGTFAGEPVYAVADQVAGRPVPSGEATVGEHEAADPESAEKQTAGAQTAPKGDLAVLFKEALTEHSGVVSTARESLERAGIRPPSRGYAFKLKNQWLEEQVQASTPGHRLTAVK